MALTNANPPRHLADVIPADAAARLKSLLLFARSRVEGRHAGDNRSVLKGMSSDFMQHRQYFPATTSSTSTGGCSGGPAAT